MELLSMGTSCHTKTAGMFSVIEFYISFPFSLTQLVIYNLISDVVTINSITSIQQWYILHNKIILPINNIFPENIVSSRAIYRTHYP